MTLMDDRATPGLISAKVQVVAEQSIATEEYLNSITTRDRTKMKQYWTHVAEAAMRETFIQVYTLL